VSPHFNDSVPTVYYGNPFPNVLRYDHLARIFLFALLFHISSRREAVSSLSFVLAARRVVQLLMRYLKRLLGQNG
jgi:hypothetical protein